MKYDAKVWILNGIVLFIAALLPSLTLAEAELPYETSAVARIVGDTPLELQNQLTSNNLELRHASFYSSTRDEYNPGENKDELIKKYFPNDYLIKSYDRRNGVAWDWGDIGEDISTWNKNSLLVVEYNGEIKDGSVVASNNIFDNNPPDSAWTASFIRNEPAVLLDFDYAGMYLPNPGASSGFFVGAVGQDSVMVAPTAVPSRQFVKSFICNIGKYGTIGEVFKQSRNNYYSGFNLGGNELVGLSLASYSLFGNPAKKVSVPNYNENDIQEYCKNYLKEFKAQFAAQSILPKAYFSAANALPVESYVQSYVVDFGQYSVVNYENYSLLIINQTFLDLGDIVLPKGVVISEFPLKTAIINISLTSLSEPADLTIANLPSWEGQFANRTCEQETKEAGIDYQHAFSEDKEILVTTISPVEVKNCPKGELTLYRKVGFLVEYIPFSPVVFENVKYPESVLPDSNVRINVTIRNIQSNPVSGSLAIREGGKIISEKEIDTNTLVHEIEFTATSAEGVKEYELEFVQDNESKTHTKFSIETEVLEAYLAIPLTAAPTTEVKLILNNRLGNALNITAKQYLSKNNALLSSGTIQQTIPAGLSEIPVAYSDLSREDESYDLLVTLLYNNNEKILSGSLVTNHPPKLAQTEGISAYEGQEIRLTPSAEDIDGDAISYIFSGAMNSDRWQTKEGDKGNYTVKITAGDGYLQDSVEVKIEVLESDYDNDGYNLTIDCNDNDAYINPNATEACNNADDNCNGQIDDNCDQCGAVNCPEKCIGTTRYYSGICEQKRAVFRTNAADYYKNGDWAAFDYDGDSALEGYGYGSVNDNSLCLRFYIAPPNYTPFSIVDIFGGNISFNPYSACGFTYTAKFAGQASGTYDNGVGNEFFGKNNEGYSAGLNFSAAENAVISSYPEEQYASNGQEIYSADAGSYYQNATRCNYRIEYNSTLCGYVLDDDGDGYSFDADCNDKNASINPGAMELCDRVDNNCNNQTDEGCECIADADCGIGGCSGQICGKKDEVKKLITTCEWLPIYGCYWLTTCSCINSKCLWKETETFSECRAKKGEGYGFD